MKRLALLGLLALLSVILLVIGCTPYQRGSFLQGFAAGVAGTPPVAYQPARTIIYPAYRPAPTVIYPSFEMQNREFWRQEQWYRDQHNAYLDQQNQYHIWGGQ